MFFCFIFNSGANPSRRRSPGMLRLYFPCSCKTYVLYFKIQYFAIAEMALVKKLVKTEQLRPLYVAFTLYKNCKPHSDTLSYRMTDLTRQNCESYLYMHLKTSQELFY